MPIVSITTWSTLPDEQKKQLLESITAIVHEVTGAPLDKVVTYVIEVSRGAWAEGGVLGSDPTFPERSRRRSYAEDDRKEGQGR